jgi:hypothetical protein
MGEGLSGQDFARVIYLVVYLLAAVAWLRQDRREADAPRREPLPRCEACGAAMTANTPESSPWGGWTCASCGAAVHAASEPAPKPGLSGFIARERWACGGALWGGVVWFALAAGAWWYGDATPGLLTFPLAAIGGFGAGWLLSRGRRA